MDTLTIEYLFYDWKLNYQYAEFLLQGLNNHNQATTQYRIVLQNLPYYFAFHKLGTIYLTMGNLDEAIELYRKALERKPTDVTLHFNLALALEKKQDFKGAISHCSKALQINPAAPVRIYDFLARLYINSKNPNKAIQVLRKSLEIYPDNVNLRINLSILCIENGKKDEAIEELNTVLKLEPDNTTTRQLLDTLKN